MWKVVDTGPNSAAENMRIDAQLLSSLDCQGAPILHFYEWNCMAATYGYFTKIERFFDLQKAEEIPLHFARRPTGGGIIFHVWDLAFSVLLPSGHRFFSKNTLQNYRLINDATLEAIKPFFHKDGISLLANDLYDQSDARFFCMAKPTIYDVMLGGKKIAGAAQRRQKQGFLHQASISLAAPKWELIEQILHKNVKILDAMQQTSYYILDFGWTAAQLDELRNLVRKALIKTITAI